MNSNTSLNSVFKASGNHDHWTWRCRCGYQTFWCFPTEADAQKDLETHQARCRADDAPAGA